MLYDKKAFDVNLSNQTQNVNKCKKDKVYKIVSLEQQIFKEEQKVQSKELFLNIFGLVRRSAEKVCKKEKQSILYVQGEWHKV